MYSAEVTARLDALRQLASQRDLTSEEQREVIALIRQDRVSAAATSAASKAKASAAKPKADDVLAKLQLALGVKKDG